MNKTTQRKRPSDMMKAVQREYIRDGLEVWAPSYPRRVGVLQEWADDADSAADILVDSQEQSANVPFLSTYSFPRGHTKSNNVPDIDTLFIDFDFEGGDYDPEQGDEDAWRRDLSHLLVRVRRVAKYLLEEGDTGWRASLSGHKGVHLFLDFPALDPKAGSFEQFVLGLGDYAADLTEHLSGGTGLGTLHKYVDVTSSDLGRLCRAPNTIHGSATESLGETRYCVPVTIPELADITVDKYAELTQSPREVPWDSRTPNERVGEVIEQYVKTASSSRASRRTGSTVDYSLVSDYEEQSNDSIELSDIKFLTSDRPCLWEFYKRDDKYNYGYQSHYMEMFCIRELLEHNVPIDVIKEFLDSAPEYDEEYSERRIREIISRDYHRFSVESILRKAPELCGYDSCSLCQKVISENPDLRRKHEHASY